MHDGLNAPGVMYLPDGPRQTGGAEDIAQLLNDDRVFVPFQSADPSVDAWIVNKRQVMRVHLQDDTTFRDDPGSTEPTSLCTLVLSDRSRLTGRLLHDTPESQSRLVDKINTAPAFMTFVSDEGVDFVHRIHVTQVFQHG